MSTDDSVSEDVSSSAALSHCHVGADGDGGKESETSMVSSEGTSAVSEDRHPASRTAGGAVPSRPVDITPACDKIRSLCLSGDEAFEPGKNLPFINPSSLETLRALVQEIQSSGETDPEIWKDCEGRWLHLFQLVEKQYQEQILAQQEQYQCQIQLIQDEIKALVQLQNRQAGVQPHADFCPSPLAKTGADPKDRASPPVSSDCTASKNVPSDSDSLAAPAHTPFSSPSPPLRRPDTANPGEERAATMLSSGYGTLSAWEPGPDPAASPGDDEDGGRGRGPRHWAPDFRDAAETTGTGSRQEADPLVHQHRTSGTGTSTGQPLTSWAQRHKLRPKKSKAGRASSQIEEASPGEAPGPNPPQSAGSQDQPPSGSFPLRRSDSLMSEASGLTYWRLAESELYRPLPDRFDSGACLLLQEASSSLTPSPEPRPSLREIYQNKRRPDCKRSDWDGSIASSPSSTQVSALDPAANPRQSDRTSGFTSPSRFSSPSFAAPPPPYPRAGTPDSAAECGPAPGDADCVSDVSSASAAGPPPSQARSPWGDASRAVPSTSRPRPRGDDQQRGAGAPVASEEEEEEEEGSGTHTSTLRPGPRRDGSAAEDPVVLSLLRQNLREKHARHVADLRAYYESEIQVLRDKLRLTDLPRDLERSNRVLADRCKRLEEALADANARVQQLEATNAALEKKLAEWPERYAVAGAAVKSLQQRLEESKRSGREKDAAAARLRSSVRQLEEAAQEARREAEEKEAGRRREHAMLQDLLAEYDALAKEHEATKNELAAAENKLLDADDRTSELKRVISKLESQVKQLEHQNQARARHAAHANTPPSGAGLFHHPDLLLSPDVARRKSPRPRPPHADPSSDAGSWRCPSPPECEQPPPPPPAPPPPPQSGRREASCALTPVMRALIQLEETRATESRAPWVGGTRTTVGFMDRRHKEPVQERGGARPGGGAAGGAALLRAQRSLSPEGHRSSSLPPPAQRHIHTATPTKRETLLTPPSARSSPKRCPTENYSTAFGHLLPREEHLLTRSDGDAERRRHSFHGSRSPRKRLQFRSADGDAADPSGTSGQDPVPVLAGVRGGREDPAAPPPLLPLDPPPSLAEAEKLFDELTQEKLQIEAALSRMPAAGSRASLQTRLDEVALENRLERLNRELGSIRMTLKRFHVLRSSANV